MYLINWIMDTVYPVTKTRFGRLKKSSLKALLTLFQRETRFGKLKKKKN